MATRFSVELALSSVGSGVREIQRDIGRVADVSERGASKLALLNRAFLTLGGAAGVVSLLRRAVTEATAADESVQRMNQALATSGRTAGVSADELESFASQIQRVTRFSDDAVRDAETTLLRFTNVQGDIFRRAMRVIVDVAAQGKRDVGDTAASIGRALEIPGKGVRALAEAGIVLSKGQQALIDYMVEHGQAAEAQSKLLAMLERRYRGAGEAAGQGYAGALAQAKNAAGDLLEVLGGAGAGRAGLIGALEEALRAFTALAQDEGIISALRLISRGLAGVYHAVLLVANAARVLPMFFAAAASKILELLTKLVTGSAELIAGFANRVLDRVRNALPGRLQGLVPDAEKLLGVDKLRGWAEKQGKVTQFFADRVVGAVTGVAGHAKALWAIFGDGEQATLNLGRAAEEAAEDLGELDEATQKLLADAARMAAALAREIEFRRRLIGIRMSTPYYELETALEAAARAHEVEEYRLEQFEHFADLGAAAATRISNALAAQKEKALELAAAEEALGRAMESARRITADLAKERVKLLDISDVPGVRFEAGTAPWAVGQKSDQTPGDFGLQQTLSLLRELRTPADEFRILAAEIEVLMLRWPFAAEGLQALLREMGAEIKWSPLVDALRQGFAGASDQVNALARGLADVVEGLVRATHAADRLGRAEGWALAAQGAFAMAEAAGLMERNVSRGGFGGRGEGNRATEGSQIGAIIGGIIGTMMGGQTVTGMAIGSAAGGILGSFIKKGAQESLGRLQLDSGDIVAAVTKSEGSLGSVIRELGLRINDAVQGLLDVLGATIDDIPPISVKVRDGIISVWVGAVNARVKEMDDAIAFATTEILKQADLSGISDVMRKVLANTKAISIDQLGAHLEFGQWYERLGLRDVARGILDAVSKFRTDMRMAADLGLDQGPVIADFIRNIQAAKDQLLGVEVDPAEQLRRNREAWDQQADLIEAEQQMRRADLLLRRADLQGKIALLQAELGIDEANLKARRGIVEGEAALVGTEIELLGALMQALSAADAALAIVDGILAGIKDMKITDEEFDAAMRRLRRSGAGAGGGADRGDEQARLREEAARMGVHEIVAALLDAQQRFDDFAERVRDAGFKGAEAAALIAAAEEELAAKRREIVDAQRAASHEFITRSTVFGGPLLTGLQDISREAQRLQDNNRALASTGQMTTREMRELNRQIRDAARAQRELLVGQETTSLLGDLYAYLGDEQKAAQLRHDLAVAELQVRREQLAIALREYGLDQSVITEIDELLRRIRAAGPPRTGDGPPAPPSPTFKGYDDQPRLDLANKTVDDALARLVEFERAAARPIDALQAELLEVNEAFAQLREALGDTERVQAAYAATVGQIVRRHLEPLLELQDRLLLSEFSPLSAMDRFFEAQKRLEAAEAAMRSGDLSGLAKMPDLIQEVLREAQAALPTGSQAYLSVFRRVNELLQEARRFGESLGGGATTPAEIGATGFGGAPPAAGVSVAPVVTELQTGRAEMSIELRAIRTATEASRSELSEIRRLAEEEASLLRGVA